MTLVVQWWFFVPFGKRGRVLHSLPVNHPQCPFIQMTDTNVTFLFSSNIVGHTHMYVMTLTSPPFLPLSRPWAGLSVRWLVHPLLRIEDHQSSSPYLIFSVSSGAFKKLTLRTSSCFPTIVPIVSVRTRHDLFLL